MLLGTIGLDPITATPRFTYGSLTLADGIGLVPMIMGLFGISEVLLNIEKGVKQDVFLTHGSRGLLPTREDWRRSAAPIARGSVLGFLLGILPGIGSIIPTFISYALERRLSQTSRAVRHRHDRGRGRARGRQQRGHRRRDDPAAHPRHRAQRGDGRARSAPSSSTACSRARS